MRAFLLLLLLAACSGSQSGGETPGPPAFAGLLSLSMHEDQPATVDSYHAAYDQSHGIGARGAQLLFHWKMLEPASGTFDFSLIQSAAFGLDYVGNTRGLKILLTISVIDVADKAVPADLAGVAFDSVQMKSRLRAFLSALAPYLNSQVIYLSLGNEVDTYFSQHPSEWSAYKSLYDDAIAHLRTIKPGLKIGVTSTFDGASGALKNNVKDLNAASDVFILTYYPVGTGFVPRAPSTVLADLPQMVALADPLPVVLQEVGYPASTLLSSSEEKQAEFVTHTFSAWRSAGSAKVPFLSFFKRKDWTQTTCDNYFPGAPASFSSFLCSLGLRKSDDSPKQAWHALVNGAAGLQ